MMKTPIQEVIDYLESKEFDHDLLDAAIVGLTDIEVVRRVLLEHLPMEREHIANAYDSGDTGWAKSGEDYYELVYTDMDEDTDM
jgi:hypothetical protein